MADIKVYVTQEQLEELQFLVNRRINDITMEKRRPRQNPDAYTNEINLLMALKTELNQAGT